MSVNWKIELYQDENGTIPFEGWFDRFDVHTQARIDARIHRMKLGNFGDRKAIGNGVYELGFFMGPGYRVYFGKCEKQIVLLLCGGDKKTQKRDIQKAMDYWRRYLEGSNE